MNNQHWDTLIEKITSGEAVDWKTEFNRYPNDVDYIKQLKSLAQIYAVCNSSLSDAVKDKKTSNQHQFIWGHLQVFEQIGVGNFGEVYRAFDPLLNRDVALKLLKAEQMSVVKSRHFMAEARSLAKVRNRHVLAIHGANLHDGRVGFWADLLVGETLADTPIDYSVEDKILEVTDAVTDALFAVHQADLIHGDVKLSNVMSDSKGKITLMDFGAGGEVDMAASTTGSPILMAPELFNEQAKTTASDIYALGVMLFKLATGQYPIKADNVLEVLQAHKNKQYESLNQLRPDLNKSVKRLINQMLAVDPKQRPDTAAINNTLNEIKAAPKKRLKRLVITGIFSILVIATLISSWGFFQANQARKIAETETEKATAVSGFLEEMLTSPREFGEGQDMKVVNLLDYSAENAIKKFSGQPAVLATIESALGQSYSALALFDKALLHIDKALALNTELYGVDHQATLDAMHSKSYVLLFLNDYHQSQALAERVIELTENNQQVKRGNFLSAYHRLASIAINQGDLEKALSYLNHDRVEILAPEIAPSNQSAFILASYSSVFFKLGNYVEAEKYARESILWNQAWLENEKNQHKVVNLIPFRNQLANALAVQGKLAEAETQYRKSLEQAKTYYGKNEVGYLTILANLGSSLYDQGKYQQALETGIIAQQISYKHCGRVCGRSIKTGISVSNSLVALERLAEGELLMRRTLSDAKELGGSESMDALMLEYNLAELLIKQGKYQEALEVSEQNHLKMQAALTDKHPFTSLALSNTATALTELNRFEEAIQAHNKAILGVEHLVGSQHPFYFVAIWNRIRFFYAIDDNEQGLVELKKLFKSQSEVLGKSHPDTLRSQKLLDDWQ